MLRRLIRVWIIGIVFPLYAIAGQPSVKITHGPYLQNLSENEVTVVWTTDKPCKSWVEFSKKEDGKNFYSQLPRKAYASQDGLCCDKRYTWEERFAEKIVGNGSTAKCRYGSVLWGYV